MSEDEKEITLTTNQLAERWKVKPALLRQMRRRKQGPKCFPVGDSQRAPIRYKLEDVVQYEGQRRKNKDEKNDSTEKNEASA